MAPIAGEGDLGGDSCNGDLEGDRRAAVRFTSLAACSHSEDWVSESDPWISPPMFDESSSADEDFADSCARSKSHDE